MHGMRERRDFFFMEGRKSFVCEVRGGKRPHSGLFGPTPREIEERACCRIGGRASAFHLKIPEGKMSEKNLRNAPVARTLCERRIIGAARERISFAGSEKQA